MFVVTDINYYTALQTITITCKLHFTAQKKNDNQSCHKYQILLPQEISHSNTTYRGTHSLHFVNNWMMIRDKE